jgi:hypothetical protein
MSNNTLTFMVKRIADGFDAINDYVVSGTRGMSLINATERLAACRRAWPGLIYIIEPNDASN